VTWCMDLEEWSFIAGCRRTVLAVACVAAALSCKESPTEPLGPPSTLTVVAGDQQTAEVGTELAEPLAVKVTDSEGTPIPGQLVNFRVVSGNGSLLAGTALTNSRGIAYDRWTLGNSIAESQRVEARAIDPTSGAPLLSTVFQATARAGAAASISKVSGDPQATVGSGASPSPAVRVADRFGNPVAGVAVTFSVASGGGSVTGESPVTDSLGIATVGTWVAGPVAGEQRLTASAGQLAPVTFIASVAPAAPARLALIFPPQVQVKSSAPLRPDYPIVQLQDAHGNLVNQSGVVVSVAVASGDEAYLSQPTAETFAGAAHFSGLEIVGLPGARTLRFSSPGLEPVVSGEISVISGPPTRIEAISQYEGQRDSVGSLVQAPVVQLKDADGNPVSGWAVRFVIPDRGAVGDTLAFTDAAGFARARTWTLSTQPGLNTVIASTNGIGLTGRDTILSTPFYAVANPGGPANIQKLTGDNQSAQAGASVPVHPTVLVTDKYGNNVPSFSVVFTVTAGGGSVELPVSKTNDAGVAGPGNWVLGPSPGLNTLQAGATGAPPVVFTATGY
jgi:adhesin/invasin